MKKLREELFDFIISIPNVNNNKNIIELNSNEEKIFRSLKTNGEKYSKGREISKLMFEAKRNKELCFLMIMEGRHSMSVGNQVMKRFRDFNISVDVIKTNKGACVIVKPYKEVDG